MKKSKKQRSSLPRGNRLLIDIPEEINERIEKQAAEQHRSRKQYIEFIVIEHAKELMADVSR